MVGWLDSWMVGWLDGLVAQYTNDDKVELLDIRMVLLLNGCVF
jgi:hypothetical protein